MQTFAHDNHYKTKAKVQMMRGFHCRVCLHVVLFILLEIRVAVFPIDVSFHLPGSQIKLDVHCLCY